MAEQFIPQFDVFLLKVLLAIGLDVSGFLIIVYLLEKLNLLVEDLFLLPLLLQLCH